MGNKNSAASSIKHSDTSHQPRKRRAFTPNARPRRNSDHAAAPSAAPDDDQNLNDENRNMNGKMNSSNSHHPSISLKMQEPQLRQQFSQSQASLNGSILLRDKNSSRLAASHLPLANQNSAVAKSRAELSSHSSHSSQKRHLIGQQQQSQQHEYSQSSIKSKPTYMQRRHSDNTIATSGRIPSEIQQQQPARKARTDNILSAVEFMADYRLCSNLYCGPVQSLVQQGTMSINSDLLHSTQLKQQQQQHSSRHGLASSQPVAESQAYLTFLQDIESTTLGQINFIELSEQSLWQHQQSIRSHGRSSLQKQFGHKGGVAEDEFLRFQIAFENQLNDPDVLNNEQKHQQQQQQQQRQQFSIHSKRASSSSIGSMHSHRSQLQLNGGGLHSSQKHFSSITQSQQQQQQRSTKKSHQLYGYGQIIETLGNQEEDEDEEEEEKEDVSGQFSRFSSIAFVDEAQQQQPALYHHQNQQQQSSRVARVPSMTNLRTFPQSSGVHIDSDDKSNSPRQTGEFLPNQLLQEDDLKYIQEQQRKQQSAESMVTERQNTSTHSVKQTQSNYRIPAAPSRVVESANSFAPADHHRSHLKNEPSSQINESIDEFKQQLLLDQNDSTMNRISAAAAAAPVEMKVQIQTQPQVVYSPPPAQVVPKLSLNSSQLSAHVESQQNKSSKTDQKQVSLQSQSTQTIQKDLFLKGKQFEKYPSTSPKYSPRSTHQLTRNPEESHTDVKEFYSAEQDDDDIQIQRREAEVQEINRFIAQQQQQYKSTKQAQLNKKNNANEDIFKKTSTTARFGGIASILQMPLNTMKSNKSTPSIISVDLSKIKEQKQQAKMMSQQSQQYADSYMNMSNHYATQHQKKRETQIDSYTRMLFADRSDTSGFGEQQRRQTTPELIFRELDETESLKEQLVLGDADEDRLLNDQHQQLKQSQQQQLKPIEVKMDLLAFKRRSEPVNNLAPPSSSSSGAAFIPIQMDITQFARQRRHFEVDNAPPSVASSSAQGQERKNSESEGESILQSVTMRLQTLKGKIQKDQQQLDRNNITYQNKIVQKAKRTTAVVSTGVVSAPMQSDEVDANGPNQSFFSTIPGNQTNHDQQQFVGEFEFNSQPRDQSSKTFAQYFRDTSNSSANDRRSGGENQGNVDQRVLREQIGSKDRGNGNVLNSGESHRSEYPGISIGSKKSSHQDRESAGGALSQAGRSSKQSQKSEQFERRYSNTHESGDENPYQSSDGADDSDDDDDDDEDENYPAQIKLDLKSFKRA